MSRVLLVNPPTPPGESTTMQRELYPSYALLLLGTILHNAGHEVKTIHMVADNVDNFVLARTIQELKPDIVGITIGTFGVKTAKEVANIAKLVSKDILTVVGGAHPSSVDLPYSNFDIVVRGEGDRIILDIADGKIRPGCYTAEAIADLDSLPFPSLHLVRINRFSGLYPPGPLPAMTIIGSRGCPFQCTFCSKSVFGNNVRFRSPENVVGEMAYLHAHWGIKEFFFMDDTFNMNRKWVEEVLDLIIRDGMNRDIRYRARCRVDERLIDLELLRRMKRAGFWELFYGVESGNQGMLDRMKKGITVEEARRAFRLTKEAGIKAEASFIIGMPGETKETIRDSVNLWRELDPYWCTFSRAIPFPNTEFDKQVRAKGHLLVNDYEDYKLGEMMVRTDALTAGELEQYARTAEYIIGKRRLRMWMKNPRGLVRVTRDGLRDRESAAATARGVWHVLRAKNIQ